MKVYNKVCLVGTGTQTQTTTFSLEQSLRLRGYRATPNFFHNSKVSNLFCNLQMRPGSKVWIMDPFNHVKA